MQPVSLKQLVAHVEPLSQTSAFGQATVVVVPQCPALSHLAAGVNWEAEHTAALQTVPLG